MLPLFIGLRLKDRKNTKIAVIGVVASTVVTIAGNSSTSLLGFGAGLFALCLWPLRSQMRPIRWGIVIVLTTLHIVMNGPVWALIQRIDVTGSSSSYHRYELVNQCIRHFGDWFLVGTKSYGDWGFDMWDLSNQYVAVAETAGLIPLIAFLALIVLGFKYLGKARKAAEGDKSHELFLWAMAAAVFANVVAYFGTSYWDQTMVAWYSLLATIPVAAAARIPKPVPQANIQMMKPALGLRPRLVPAPARGSLVTKGVGVRVDG
jgi:O-antigen ligase